MSIETIEAMKSLGELGLGGIGIVVVGYVVLGIAKMIIGVMERRDKDRHTAFTGIKDAMSSIATINQSLVQAVGLQLERVEHSAGVVEGIDNRTKNIKTIVNETQMSIADTATKIDTAMAKATTHLQSVAEIVRQNSDAAEGHTVKILDAIKGIASMLDARPTPVLAGETLSDPKKPA